MDLRIMVQELRNSQQGAFDFVIAGSRGRTRHDGDKRGEFVDDPVVELVEEQRLLRNGEARDELRHHALLLISNHGEPRAAFAHPGT